MHTRAHIRRRLAAAILTSVLGATQARAQAPAADDTPQVEVFHGAKKVWPRPVPPAPPPPKPVVPAEYKGGPVVEVPGRASAAFEAACVAVKDGSTSVSKAATNLLDRVADRMAVQTEARQIVLASYAPSVAPAAPVSVVAPPANLPWLTPVPTTPPTQPSAVSTPQTPTVLVIREPGEVQRVEVPVPMAALPEPRGVVMTPELMIAAGFGVFGLMVGLAAWARGGRAVRPQYVPLVAPALAGGPGVRLQGKYDAGPVPESAEKFDLGPTYHDELHEKKQVEVRSNEAVVQFILDQNLAMLDAIGGPLAEEVDDADFEISANS